MLRKWRRNIKRRLDDESGKISVEKGLVISAVLGSAISVVLCSTNISEHNEQNNNILLPQVPIKNEQSFEVVMPKVEIPKYDINEKKDIINRFKPIVAQAVEQVMITKPLGHDSVIIQEELAEYAEVEISSAVPEQLLLSAEDTDLNINVDANIDISVDKQVVTATNVIENQQASKQIAEESTMIEATVIRQNNELVKSNIDTSTEKIRPLVSVVTAKVNLEGGLSKVSAQKASNHDSDAKDKPVKNTAATNNTKVVASAVTTKIDKNKAVSDGKISISEAEIAIAVDNVAVTEVIKMNGESTIISSETTKTNGEDIASAVEAEIINPNIDSSNFAALQVSNELSKQEIVKNDSSELKTDNTLNSADENKVIIIDNVVVAELITNDKVVLQAVNNEEQLYTIADKSDGSTTMTMISNNADTKNAAVGMLSSADITVFKVSKGEISYNGTYYAENNIKGLTMEQRIVENIEKPSVDSTKVQGTYMTMDWKNNPSSDFFIGFNGSALVVYPLDNEAKTIVSATDSLNNRPIVASSIINALGNMDISLAQIQSVSIYAE